MRIYTYCSCRSSRYGYQYASFDSDSTDIARSMLSSERCDVISEEFTKWCEDRSGWQLVLERGVGGDKYLLMAGQLEKSKELEKKERKRRGETDFNENHLDSDFYMTLGFLGTASEIKPVAMFLLEQYEDDGFRELFNRLEKIIRKAWDAARYEINTAEFNTVFVDLESPAPPKSVFLSKAVRRIKTSPDIRLSVDRARAERETRQARRDNVHRCIKLLPNMEGFSERILLLIAYDCFRISDQVNIHIDYEYLW